MKPRLGVRSFVIHLVTLSLLLPPGAWAQSPRVQSPGTHEETKRINPLTAPPLEKDGPCPNSLTEDEKEKIEAEVTALNANILAGQIPKEDAIGKIGDIMKQFGHPGDENRDGEVVSVVHGAMDAGINLYVFKRALDNLTIESGTGSPNHTPSPFPNVTKEGLDRLVDEATGKIAPHVAELKKAGLKLTYDSQTGGPKWSFPKRSLNAETIKNNPRLREAFGAIFSEDFANKISDPQRADILSVGDQVILPPSSNNPKGQLGVQPRDFYDAAIKRTIDRFGDDLKALYRQSKEMATRDNFMKHVFEDTDFETAIESDVNTTEKLLRREIKHLKEMGVPKETLSHLGQGVQKALQFQGAQLESVVKAFDAEVDILQNILRECAETAVLAVATAGVGVVLKGAVMAAKYGKTAASMARAFRLGVRATKNTRTVSKLVGGGFLGVISFPTVLSGLTSAYSGAVEAFRAEDGSPIKAFSCEFNKQLARRGPEAIYNGLWYTKIPAATIVGTGGIAALGTAALFGKGAQILGPKLSAGLAKAGEWVQRVKDPARGAVTNGEKAVHASTGVLFTGVGAVGAWGAGSECVLKFNEAAKLEHDGEKEVAHVAYTEVWKKCGDAFLDAAMAIMSANGVRRTFFPKPPAGQVAKLEPSRLRTIYEKSKRAIAAKIQGRRGVAGSAGDAVEVKFRTKSEKILSEIETLEGGNRKPDSPSPIPEALGAAADLPSFQGKLLKIGVNDLVEILGKLKSENPPNAKAIKAAEVALKSRQSQVTAARRNLEKATLELGRSKDLDRQITQADQESSALRDEELRINKEIEAIKNKPVAEPGDRGRIAELEAERQPVTEALWANQERLGSLRVARQYALHKSLAGKTATWTDSEGRVHKDTPLLEIVETMTPGEVREYFKAKGDTPMYGEKDLAWVVETKVPDQVLVEMKEAGLITAEEYAAIKITRKYGDATDATGGFYGTDRDFYRHSNNANVDATPALAGTKQNNSGDQWVHYDPLVQFDPATGKLKGTRFLAGSIGAMGPVTGDEAALNNFRKGNWGMGGHGGGFQMALGGFKDGAYRLPVRDPKTGLFGVEYDPAKGKTVTAPTTYTPPTPKTAANEFYPYLRAVDGLKYSAHPKSDPQFGVYHVLELGEEVRDLRTNLRAFYRIQRTRWDRDAKALQSDPNYDATDALRLSPAIDLTAKQNLERLSRLGGYKMVLKTLRGDLEKLKAGRTRKDQVISDFDPKHNQVIAEDLANLETQISELEAIVESAPALAAEKGGTRRRDNAEVPGSQSPRSRKYGKPAISLVPAGAP